MAANIARALRRPIARPSLGAQCVQPAIRRFSAAAVRRSGGGHEETFDEFNQRYEKEFENVNDVFELQRNLNNAFAYDLVPTTAVVTAALRAARRVNDFPTAVRVFEGLKVKVENKSQYEEYLQELEPIREELGIDLKEDLYPEQSVMYLLDLACQVNVRL